jgi:hypothetical protein
MPRHSMPLHCLPLHQWTSLTSTRRRTSLSSARRHMGQLVGQHAQGLWTIQARRLAGKIDSIPAHGCFDP